MNFIADGLWHAVSLVLHLDPELRSALAVSLVVSSTSTLLASLVGIPLGFLIAVGRFRGKQAVIACFNALMALPTVLVGLLVYSLLSRMGLFGSFGLLYTPWAMILGQFVLIVPLITALCIASVASIDRRIAPTLVTLGAGRMQRFVKMIVESKTAILATIIAGFGRVFSEVGASMMLGGNIRGYTRNMTTAIAFETVKGEFALGIALGVILLVISFSLNILLNFLHRENPSHAL